MTIQEEFSRKVKAPHDQSQAFHIIQSKNEDEPVIPAHISLPEITWKVLILGVFLTIILAAANAFLGLKVGTTVSASIPAAVISMGILRFFKNSNVLENTMVQIMASVGEALTAGIAFILPALLILHVWDNFNYWQTVTTALLGGTLGVLFTIPLRRALLQDKSLRYPEAIAIANVLKASTKSEKGDLHLLTAGGFVGGLIALFQSGFQILTDSFQFWFKSGNTIFGFGLGLSPALIAAGYIVGINVALSMLVGVTIGWVIGIPTIAAAHAFPAASSATEIAMLVWKQYIRYIGVGAMLVGGLWTMCTLFKPVVNGMVTSFRTFKDVRSGKSVNLRTERDIPINYVLMTCALLLVPFFFLISNTIIPESFQLSNGFRYFISAIGAVYILFGGFLFCSISAYFAGLIGSTNNPVSGMLVSALLIICLIFIGLFSLQTGFITDESKELLGSIIAIGSMVAIGGAIAISNDTMQDLKVGQMMGATPWKQQVMLLLGVIVTAFVIPPILQLLYSAYGIGGVFPRPDMNPAQMLAAPQAGMMATVAKGAFSHQLEWGMIGIGALVAVACIIGDEIAKKYGTRLPVLAVGVGIYLPLDSSVPVIIGGILSYIICARLNRMYTSHDETSESRKDKHLHRGLTLACGLVAGASLMGVILAIPFAIKQSSDALKIMPDELMPFAGIFSIVVTIMLCTWIYRAVLKRV